MEKNHMPVSQRVVKWWIEEAQQPVNWTHLIKRVGTGPCHTEVICSDYDGDPSWVCEQFTGLIW